MAVYFGKDNRTLSDIVEVTNPFSNEFAEYRTIGSLLIKPIWLSSFPSLSQGLFTNKLNKAMFKVIQTCYENDYHTIDYSDIEQAFSVYGELANAQQYITETLGNDLEQFITALREIQTNDVSKCAKDPSPDIRLLRALKIVEKANSDGIDISSVYDIDEMRFKHRIGSLEGLENFFYRQRDFDFMSDRDKLKVCEELLSKAGIDYKTAYSKWEVGLYNEK